MEPLLAALRAAGVSAQHGVSREKGDEGRLAVEAARSGVRTVVAVGGDGTWGNVASALLAAGHAGTALGFVAGGTGCDFAKTLGVPARDLAATARLVAQGRTRQVDVGRVEGRHFLNIVGFGIDIAVLEDSWNVHWLGGGAVYVYCAARQLFRYPGFPLSVRADGADLGRPELMMLIIANARNFGGSFRIAPRASLEDGQLDYVAFRNMPPHRRALVMAHILGGRHGGDPEVDVRRGRSFALRFDAPPAYETDGEWNRATGTELTVECVPGALRVLMGEP